MTNQGIHFICFKIDHLCKESPSVQLRSCYYRKRIGQNHCSIWPKKFDHGQSSNDTAGQSSNRMGGHDQSSSSTGDQTLVKFSSESGQSQPSVDTSDTTVEPVLLANNINLSHSLLACGERVLLQTTRLTVLAEDGSRIFAKLLLDSTSQWTFMTH